MGGGGVGGVLVLNACRVYSGIDHAPQQYRWTERSDMLGFRLACQAVFHKGWYVPAAIVDSSRHSWVSRCQLVCRGGGLHRRSLEYRTQRSLCVFEISVFFVFRLFCYIQTVQLYKYIQGENDSSSNSSSITVTITTTTTSRREVVWRVTSRRGRDGWGFLSPNEN